MQVGMKGSIAHVLTNDKIEDKGACFKEMAKEGIKDTLVLSGVTAGTAGAAALATGCSNKAAGAFNQLKTKAGEILSKISVNGENLKDIVKNSSIYKKINTLPTPAKAAIAAGAAAIALVGSIMTISAQSKAGYIEGKHEVK